MTNDISGHAVPPRTKRPRRTKIARKEEICGTVMAFIPVLRCILFSLIPMVLALVMAFYNMKKPVSFEGAKFCGLDNFQRSEERRVGKACRSRWSPYHYKQ